MAIFSKIPSRKKITNHSSDLTISSDTHTYILGMPMPLSDSLSMEELSMLTWIDIYRLRYSREDKLRPLVLFSYDNVISKPPLSEANSLLKQKKETDLLLYNLELWDLTPYEHMTFIPEFSSRVGTLFAKLFKKGVIRYDYQSVYRNTRYQTIAPSENVRFENEETLAYTVKYFVSTKNHSLDIYVKDPSTIFGDVAIAINPLHKKAKVLKGQMAIIPIINKTIPIIIDERADFGEHWWIMRITPAHDKVSLTIAKDHGLPLDIESFDSFWNFSSHAWLFTGKSVQQFLPNIVQNLLDIGNLINKHPLSIKSPFSRLTNERLFERTHKGWFLEIPEEILKNFSQDVRTHWCFGENIPTISSIFPVSTPSALWYRLPVRKKSTWEIIIVDEPTIVNAFSKNKTKHDNILLSLFVFHAIQEGNLSSCFAIEDIVSLFFAPGFIKDESLLQTWINLYKVRYPNYIKEVKTLEKMLSMLNNDSINESAIERLAEHLQSSFALKSNAKWIFEFDLSQVDPELIDAVQSKETISTYLLHHFLLLDACWFFKDTIEESNPIILFSQKDYYKFWSCSLLAYFLQERFPRKQTFSFTPYHDTKTTLNSQNIKKHIQTYGADVIRQHLMDNHPNKSTNQEESLEETMHLLQTFWNACRYIKTNLFDGKKIRTLDQFYLSISDWVSSIHAFDSWIIWTMQSLLEDWKTIRTPLEITSFSHKILQFMKEDFSGKYIELIKTTPSELSNDIALLISWFLIKLLFPYAPSTMSELWEQMGFVDQITTPLPLTFFPWLQKSYLISLFMELIDKLWSLKTNILCKKHDCVSVFIKANPDFLKFCQSHEILVKKTLHAEDISYLTQNEHAPSSYIQEDIIDITIGIKRFSKDNPFCLASLTKKLSEKQDYLQHLRNLLSSLNTNWWSPEIITKKREEIQAIKDEIEEMELEINKLKMNA